MNVDPQKSLSGSMRRFLYVVSSEKAKTKIPKFREKWKIDPGGFKNKNDYYQWLQEIIVHPPIKSERVVLKVKITDYAITKTQIVKGKTKESSGITDIKTSQQQLFNDNFQKAIAELGIEVKMDNSWKGIFTRYLLWGDKALISKSETSLDILKITEYYEEGKPIREKLIIFIEPNTTKTEVISAWERFIEKEKTSMVGFVDVPPNWKLDISR